MTTDIALPRWTPWVVLAGLLGYVTFLGCYFAPVAAGADSVGYMYSGRLFAEGRLTMPLRPVPEITPRNPMHLAPLGFEPRRFADRLDPTYPCGLPLHLAVAYLIFGSVLGTAVVGIGAAVATVWLCHRLARDLGVQPLLAAAGAVALGLCPVLLFTSMLPLSDTLAAAWCLGAYVLAVRADRSWRWALAAGGACGIAVLVRPSCLFALWGVPFLLRGWRTWLLVALGGMPAAAWLLFYQKYLYGGALASGYGPILSAFHWECFKPTMVNYGTWLPRVLPAGMLAFLLAPWLPWRTRMRELLALFVWFLVLFFFYTFYDISQQAWWYLRFVLPGMPALIVLAMCGLQQVIEHRFTSRMRLLLPLSALLVAASPLVVLKLWERKTLHVLLLKSYEQLYIDVPLWLKAHAAPNTIVASLTLSGTVYYYTDLRVLRWDQMEKEDFATYAPAFAAAKRPVMAALLREEVDQAINERMPGPGHWEKVTEIDICTLWRWVPPP